MASDPWSRRRWLTSLLAVPAGAAIAQVMDICAQDASPSPSPPPRVPAGAAGVASGESFRKAIKLLGGPGFPDLKGQENWDNNITITADTVTFEFARNKYPAIVAPVGDVTTIVYGQASSRHVGRWVAVGVLLAPLALFGLFHKQRKHNVLVSWTGEGGQERGAYFEVSKEHFRRLLNTLSYRTGKPVFADEKERKWLRTQGVQAAQDPTESTDKK